MILDTITIYGVKDNPSVVLVDGQNGVNFSFDEVYRVI